MATKPKRIVYWDSNVWIALINKETSNEIYDGAVYAMERVAKGDVILCMSALIRLELYQTTLDQDNQVTFAEICKRENVVQVSVSKKIVDMAYDLQMEAGRLIKGKRLKTVDAIHLATSVYNKCDYLYVADGDLLKLDGVIKSRRTPHIIPPPLAKQTKIDFKE